MHRGCFFLYFCLRLSRLKFNSGRGIAAVRIEGWLLPLFHLMSDQSTEFPTRTVLRQLTFHTTDGYRGATTVQRHWLQ